MWNMVECFNDTAGYHPKHKLLLATIPTGILKDGATDAGDSTVLGSVGSTVRSVVCSLYRPECCMELQ